MLDIDSTEFARIRNHTIVLDTRQSVGPNVMEYTYSLIGDGNPHQNYIITQQGGTVISCSPGASTMIGKTTTVGWSISIGGGAVGAESGDLGAFNPFTFTVQESIGYTVGQSFPCVASAQSACVLVYQGATAYTVDVTQTTTTPAGGVFTQDLGQQVILAPNAKGAGSTAALGIINENAGVQQCRDNVDRSVNYYCGPPGGPEYWEEGTINPGPWDPKYRAAQIPSFADCPYVVEADHFTA